MKKIYTVAVTEKCCGFGGFGYAAVPGANQIDAVTAAARRAGGDGIAENAYTGELFVKNVSASSVAAVRRIGAEYVKEFIASIHDAARDRAEKEKAADAARA